MFSTDQKPMTLRTARAQAVIVMGTKLVEVLKNKSGPKGDALEAARVAGVMAAKRTPDLIPYCHPMPLDQVTLNFELGATSVRIESAVRAVWKTGVEMEALVAAQMAATVIFDMLKPLNAAMTITDVKVLEKTGGKTSFAEKIPDRFKVAVLVSSDGTFAGKRPDKSGKIIMEKFEKYGIRPVDYKILPDERDQIIQALKDYREQGFDLVVTTGGTGLGPRDVTVEATRLVIDREIPGIMEAARMHGQQRTPYAMLSRGVAGCLGKTIVINLPGSSNGVRESLDAIFPYVLHAYPMMGGGGH